MYKLFAFITAFLPLASISCAQQKTEPKENQPAAVPKLTGAVIQEHPSEIVDFDAYALLVTEVQAYRKDRRVNLDRFLELARQPNTIILDTRSQRFYEMKHVKGAVNLCFSDFTMKSLATVIPNQETTILIYCNNNFANELEAFPSKSYIPPMGAADAIAKKPVSLALNIPTFINLYGYGYRNIYELESMVSVFDTRLAFEGTMVVETDR